MRIKCSLVFILFIVIAVFIGFRVETAIIFVSVLIHEMAHVAVALFLNVDVDEIELSPIGGTARMEDISKLGGLTEAIISLAGPMMSGLLYFICSMLTPYNDIFSIGAKYNLALMLFNIIPALPMDGGRIVRNFLMNIISYKAATIIMSRAGQLLALGFMAYNIWIITNGANTGAYMAVGIFIFAGTLKEKKYMSYIYLMNINDKKSNKMKKNQMRIRKIKASQSTRLCDLAKVFSPNNICQIHVNMGRDEIILEEADIMEGIMQKGYTAVVGEIV